MASKRKKTPDEKPLVRRTALKTHKLLWGRSGNICAFPGCNTRLSVDATETDDPSLIGEEAHICGHAPGAARYDETLPPEKRELYDNLILLCRNDHKKVDDQEESYPVDALREMKVAHEARVVSSLLVDPAKVRAEAAMADIVDDWVRQADLDRWQIWVGNLFYASQPLMDVATLERLDGLGQWLYKRHWPSEPKDVVATLRNFERILGHLLGVFLIHAEKRGDELITPRFYKSDHWVSDYDARVEVYKAHVQLVEDLAAELTRAGNLVIQTVRERVWPSFREAEGALVYERGPNWDLRFSLHRAEYDASRQVYAGSELEGRAREALKPPFDDD